MSEPYRFTSKRDVSEALAEELERLRPAELDTDELAAIISGWSLASWADLARGSAAVLQPPKRLLACRVCSSRVTRDDAPTYVPPPDSAPESAPRTQPSPKAKADRLLLLARATNLEEMATVFELGGDPAWADELRLRALGARDAGRRV